MVLLALGAGQHRVVVGDDGAPGVLVVEAVAVDPGRATHQAVGRGAHDQLVDVTPAALGGDGEPAVLGEAAAVGNHQG